jgi:[ribosomal protein S18]-alanine N-acetyltransferase
MIRPATLADLADLAALEELLFPDDMWSADQLTEELTAPHRQGWVWEDGSVLGYAITMTVGDLADLQRIGVHPARQRSGVAKALLTAAMEAAKVGRADRMLLEVSAANTAAVGFYAAAGFTEIDRRPRYYKDGSDAIVMRRSLAAGCNWGPDIQGGAE